MSSQLEEDKESYITCEECSKARGKVVRYHEWAIRKVEFFMLDPHWECPRGHTVKMPEKK